MTMAESRPPDLIITKRSTSPPSTDAAATTTAPPPLPTVAVPRRGRKRRLSTLSVDAGHASDELRSGRNGARRVSISEHSTNTGQSGLDDGTASVTSSVEDLLDNAEVNPYAPFLEGEASIREKDAQRMRKRLFDLGPEAFLREMFEERRLDPRLLGTVFGIDPSRSLIADDARYLHILGLAVMRAYYKRRKLAQYNTIDDAARLLQRCSKIMIITGAGISTSLGIPDFRSKHGGFYTRLLEEGYDDPESVFDIQTFDYDPRLFYKLAGNILPDMKRYSPTHAFIRMLQDKGKLQRNYTQNIDALEQAAGIKEELLVQCHGSFATATCRKNRTHKVKGTDIFESIRAQQVAYCRQCARELANRPPRAHSGSQRRRHAYEDDDSNEDDDDGPGVMKPDITFFGEQLPDTFFDRFTAEDAPNVDLVLVIGTSLKVAPVSEMPHHLPANVPHIYISREPIEHVNFDIQLLGDCDTIVFELARRAGWNLQHEMIPPGFRARIEPSNDSTYRWIVVRSQSRELTTSPSRPKILSSTESTSRTSSPVRPTLRPTNSGIPPRVASPAFRPIPGSPSRRPVSTPTPPPTQSARFTSASPARTHTLPVVPHQYITNAPRATTLLKSQTLPPQSSTPTLPANPQSATTPAEPITNGKNKSEEKTSKAQQATSSTLIRPAQVSRLAFLNANQKERIEIKLTDLWTALDNAQFGSESARELESQIRKFGQRISKFGTKVRTVGKDNEGAVFDD